MYIYLILLQINNHSKITETICDFPMDLDNLHFFKNLEA